jgi:sugar O-acyltransferase (sialic acid O-acetyltransferase NeuD family)
MKKIFIFGLGTLAELAEYYITSDMELSFSGYIVDDDFFTKKTKNDYPVFCWSEFVKNYHPHQVKIFSAIGYKSFKQREILFKRFKLLGYDLINIISKKAYVANNVLLGSNLFIMPGVVVEPNVLLGNNNVVWSNTTICHDIIMGDHNFIAANTTMGGFVKIGNSNFFGFSSIVLQHVVVGDNNLIGAQSLITENIQNNSHFHGSPARFIKKNCSDVGVEF